jgi:hypothetical protein
MQLLFGIEIRHALRAAIAKGGLAAFTPPDQR